MKPDAIERSRFPDNVVPKADYFIGNYTEEYDLIWDNTIGFKGYRVIGKGIEDQDRLTRSNIKWTPALQAQDAILKLSGVIE